MTTTCNRKLWRLHMSALAIAPGWLCFSTTASADTRMGLNMSAAASMESNPYLNGGGADLSGSLVIDPWLKLSDSVSSVDLSGDLVVRQYTKNANGTDISGTLSVGASHRISPYFSVQGGANYLTSRNGINQGFAIVGPNDPLPPSTTPLPDVSLAGTRTRTHAISGYLGASARPSALDQISVSFTASRSYYGSSLGKDFSYLNAGVNYARTLSEHTSLTASVRYGKSNYKDNFASDGTTITPQVGISMALSSRTSLSASIGASISRSKRLDGSTRNAASLSGDLRLCRTQENGAMCLSAARTAQPTGLGSISTVTSVAFEYDTRLSRRDHINVSLGFDNNDSSDFGLPRTSKYYSAGVSWSHTFGRRVSMYVSPSYARTADFSRSYGSVRVSVGLHISFGATS